MNPLPEIVPLQNHSPAHELKLAIQPAMGAAPPPLRCTTYEIVGLNQAWAKELAEVMARLWA